MRLMQWDYTPRHIQNVRSGEIMEDSKDQQAINRGGVHSKYRPIATAESFLRASAMLKHVIDIGWTSVCLSVRPSHAGIVSKRLNILLSCFLRTR